MLGGPAAHALRKISADALPACSRCCSCLAVQPPAQVLDADLHGQALCRRQRLRTSASSDRSSASSAQTARSHKRKQSDRVVASCTRRLHSPARVRERNDRRWSNFWRVAWRTRGTLRAVSGRDRRYACQTTNKEESHEMREHLGALEGTLEQAHRAWCTQSLVHAEPGARRAWCTQSLVHAEPGARRAWCTQSLELHRPSTENSSTESTLCQDRRCD